MLLRIAVVLVVSWFASSGLVFAAEPAPSEESHGVARFDRNALEMLSTAKIETEVDLLMHWASPEARRAGDTPRAITTVLRRIEVYAADAQVLEATADGFRVLPRDARLHFVGVGTVGQRFGLSFDPESGAAEGILLRDGRMYGLQGQASDDGLSLDARDLDAPLANGDFAVGACSGDLSLESSANDKTFAKALADGIAAARPGSARPRLSFAPRVATRQVTVAVDTDNNFLLRKFSNNTTSATNYVAALFTALNAVYEDDPAQFGLQLRLLQGTLILRPSTTPDPFNNADTSATGAALTEFGGWWRSNQVGVPRAFALLLSGNSSNQNSASGIAWLLTSGTYCDATGSGAQNFGQYSVNQVFWNPGLAASQDAYLVAHELGHNLGARHTHCASSVDGSQASTGTIDRCFNGESGLGCFSGTQACAVGSESPVAPQGTLMSYCHLNGLSCGVSTEIHPTHVTQLNGRIASQPSTCVAPLGGNTAPLIGIEAGSAAYSENASPVLVSANATASDAEGNWSGGSLAVAIGAGASADDRLSISTASGLSIASGTLSLSGTAFATVSPASGQVSGSSALTVSFTANATNARVQTLVRALQFDNISNAPAVANRSVAFTLRDGSSALATGTSSRTVTVTAINDAPTVSAPANLSVSAGSGVFITPVSYADVDAAAGDIAVVATYAAGSGTFTATSAGGVTVAGSGTGNLTLSGQLSAINGFLSSTPVRYLAAAAGAGTVALNLSINDQGNIGGGALSGNATVNVNVTALDRIFANGFETLSMLDGEH